MKYLFKTVAVPAFLIRVVVGLVFLSEGIQKFIRPDEVGVGRFTKIGFDDPEFWARFTGWVEITCGFLVLIGLITRLATIPLLTIMATAFVTTKWPILKNDGFWSMAHEYRTDFAMTILLIYLLIYGAGLNSLDAKIYKSTF